MATNSSIEWTEATWNPVSGCTRVSAGCDHCYAVTMTHRLAGMGQEKYAGLTVLNPRGERHFNGEVRCHPEALDIPLRRKKPTVYFVNSMSDLFHKGVPFEFIDRVFAVMGATDTRLPLPKDLRNAKPWHTYQVLTKRPDRMAEYLESRNPRNYRQGEWPLFKVRGDVFRGHGLHLMNAAAVLSWPLPNVWLGTSVENQAAADERIPHLLRCPAAVRFLSCEPLLGEVDLSRALNIERSGVGEWMPAINGAGPNIDWVIVGGESGPGARPCDIGWIRSIVGQCRAAGVACFVKQLGAHPFDSERCHPSMVSAAPHSRGWPTKDKKGSDPAEWPADLRVRDFPTTTKDNGND